MPIAWNDDLDQRACISVRSKIVSPFLNYHVTSPHLSSLSSVAHKAPKFSTISVGISAFASQISDVSEKKVGGGGWGAFFHLKITELKMLLQFSAITL